MNASSGPIFIGGCDRSGTTLLGDILGSANEAFVSPESQFVHDMMIRWHQRQFHSTAEAAAWLCAHFRYSAWNLRLPRRVLEGCLDLDDLRASVNAILAAYKAQHGLGGQCWVDHTPDNAKFHSILNRSFPRARFIHLVRDGRAVYRSVQRLDWGPNNAYSASRFWAERTEQGLQMEFALAGRCRRIRYEDLLRHPERTVADLCDWLGLSYDPRMLEGGALRLPGFTRDQHRLVGRRPDASRIDEWRRQLTRREVEVFESYPRSRELLRSFDYTLLTPPGRSHSVGSAAWYRLHEGLLYAIHRIRHRRMERRSVRRYAQQITSAR